MNNKGIYEKLIKLNLTTDTEDFAAVLNELKGEAITPRMYGVMSKVLASDIHSWGNKALVLNFPGFPTASESALNDALTILQTNTLFQGEVFKHHKEHYCCINKLLSILRQQPLSESSKDAVKNVLARFLISSYIKANSDTFGLPITFVDSELAIESGVAYKHTSPCTVADTTNSPYPYAADLLFQLIDNEDETAQRNSQLAVGQPADVVDDTVMLGLLACICGSPEMRHCAVDIINKSEELVTRVTSVASNQAQEQFRIPALRYLLTRIRESNVLALFKQLIEHDLYVGQDAWQMLQHVSAIPEVAAGYRKLEIIAESAPCQSTIGFRRTLRKNLESCTLPDDMTGVLENLIPNSEIIDKATIELLLQKAPYGSSVGLRILAMVKPGMVTDKALKTLSEFFPWGKVFYGNILPMYAADEIKAILEIIRILSEEVSKPYVFQALSCFITERRAFQSMLGKLTTEQIRIFQSDSSATLSTHEKEQNVVLTLDNPIQKAAQALFAYANEFKRLQDNEDLLHFLLLCLKENQELAEPALEILNRQDGQDDLLWLLMAEITSWEAAPWTDGAMRYLVQAKSERDLVGLLTEVANFLDDRSVLALKVMQTVASNPEIRDYLETTASQPLCLWKTHPDYMDAWITLAGLYFSESRLVRMAFVHALANGHISSDSPKCIWGIPDNHLVEALLEALMSDERQNIDAATTAIFGTKLKALFS